MAKTLPTASNIPEVNFLNIFAFVSFSLAPYKVFGSVIYVRQNRPYFPLETIAESRNKERSLEGKVDRVVI